MTRHWYILLLLIVLLQVTTAATNIMGDTKKVILQFKKEAKEEDKQKLIDELKGQGATITNEDNKNSIIMPFIAAEIPESSFSALQSGSLQGDHPVVKHIEEDGEMRIQ